MRRRYWFLALLALLALPALACGSDRHYSQENEITVNGDAASVAIMIGQDSNMRQDNSFNGGYNAGGGGDDGYGAIMAVGGVALCAASVLVFGLVLSMVGGIEFRYK